MWDSNPLAGLIGAIYLLTVVPISGVKEMKFMDMGRIRKFDNLSLGKDVVIVCAP